MAVSSKKTANLAYRRESQRTITLDSSYPTGGYALTPTHFQLATLALVVPHGVATDGTNARLVSFNDSTNKLQVFVPATGAEVANGVDLSTYSVRVSGIGA